MAYFRSALNLKEVQYKKKASAGSPRREAENIADGKGMSHAQHPAVTQEMSKFGNCFSHSY